MINYVIGIRDNKANKITKALLVPEDEVETLKRSYGVLVNGKDEILTNYCDDFDLLILFKLEIGADLTCEAVDSLLINLGALKKDEK